MAKVLITIEAAGSLPEVCVLTGSTKDITSAPFQFKQIDEYVVAKVTKTTTMLLPVNRDAYAAHVRRGRVCHATKVIAALAFFVALFSGLSHLSTKQRTFPVVAATMAALSVLTAAASAATWIRHRRNSPRMRARDERQVALDLPSRVAAEVIAEHVESVEHARSKRNARRVKTERRERARTAA